ncbi:MAG: hypothetical protein HW380_1957 [Magnetococcales bacterium]|nr:hypothetical protein [Magnetococcales bacterium]
MVPNILQHQFERVCFSGLCFFFPVHVAQSLTHGAKWEAE